MRNVVFVETNQEEISEEDLGKPDREEVLMSSEGGGSDQGLLADNLEDSPARTSWVENRRTVDREVHSTTPDSTLQDTPEETGVITARMVKESDVGIDDEILQAEQTKTETEVEDDQVDEDLPLVEEAVYEEQPSEDDIPEEDLELAEQIEQGLIMAQDKEERVMRKNKELAKYVTIGLEEAVRRFPLEKTNNKVEDEDGAHYSLEEKREREAQEEKERAEARREDSRVKGSSSQKRSGQQKAKGGSPGWADDL